MERACPNCGQAVEVPEGADTYTCETCRKRFKVPTARTRKGPELPLVGSAGTRALPPAVIVVVQREGEVRREVSFRAAEVSIGSGPCDIQVSDPDVRRVHAVLLVRGQSDLAIADRSVDPGTRVGDRTVRGGEAPLRPGEVVTIGATRITVRAGATVARRRGAGVTPCDRTRPYVFVAFSRRDRDAVFRDIRALQAAGLSLWWDAKEVESGTRWTDEVEAALSGAAVMVVFLSAAALDSMYLRTEVRRAASLRKPIVPVALDRAALTHDMRDLDGLHVTARFDLDEGDYREGLVQSLERHLRRAARQPRPRPW